MNAAKQANTIGAQIFHRLLDVVPDLMTLSAGNYGCSEVSGKHPSGDMIPDPDMQITVYLSDEYAEAQTFQDFYGFRAVETMIGQIDQRTQRELNNFLASWLANLIEQGHRIVLKE